MPETKLPSCWTIVAGIAAGLIVLIWSSTTVAQTELQNNTERRTFNIPVAIYIVDTDNRDESRSSQRTIKSMENHFLQVNRVWSQAGIKIDPVAVRRVNVPWKVLSGLIHKRGRGGIANFFKAIRQGKINLGQTNDNTLIRAFYTRTLGGPNGMHPLGTNSIFVADYPSNEDYRVTSHEIGHVLGLYHTQDSVSQLLYPGSNGLVLNEVEKTVARYVAERLLR